MNRWRTPSRMRVALPDVDRLLMGWVENLLITLVGNELNVINPLCHCAPQMGE